MTVDDRPEWGPGQITQEDVPGFVEGLDVVAVLLDSIPEGGQSPTRLVPRSDLTVSI